MKILANKCRVLGAVQNPSKRGKEKKDKSKEKEKEKEKETSGSADGKKDKKHALRGIRGFDF